MTTTRARIRRKTQLSENFTANERIGSIEYDGIEQIEVDRLKPFPGNPRVHNEEQVHILARMILTTRLMTPLTVTGDERVIAGECRLAAAKLLGIKRVPVIRVRDRSEAELLAYRLADNRAVELGKWDERLLAVRLKELVDLKPNFNLEAVGWKMPEIEMKLASLAAPFGGEEEADAVPEPQPDPVSRLGDIWLCGRHRVLNGSALKRGDFLLLMEGQLARMILQDGPYNVSITKHVGGLGEIQHHEFPMATGEMSREQFLRFLTDQLRLNAANCVPGGILMSFMDWRSIDLLIAAGHANDLELINICVWVKNNGSMGSLYRSKHELICVFRKKGGKSINDVQLGKHGRYRTNVWHAPGANSFGKNRMEELSSHPTPKNVDTFADAMRDVSHIGDIVVDSFLGSGTTLIAAERTERIAYGIELDPIYVDVAIRRWERFTGREAVLSGDGRTFREIAAERAG